MSHINLDLQASHKMLMLLDEANANTESAIDQIPGIFLIINEDHEVLRTNLGFTDLLGLDAEDTFRLPLSKFFRKGNWTVFAYNIKQILDAPSPDLLVRFEMGLVVENSGIPTERPFHWTLARSKVVTPGEGPLVTVFGDDISEMKEAERRLTKVFTSIPLGIFTLNKDGSVGEAYSSYLESMLNHGKLAGAAVEDVLFKPALATMSEQASAGIGSIRACLGRSELEYGSYARTFPQEIFHNTHPDPERGHWLRITYQPIVFDRIVEQLLIILEDRTAIVNAEKEMLGAARERENAMALEKQSRAVYENAIRDPLTGLYARLYMKDSVAALLWSHDHDEIAEAAMVIFDIDHFKSVNDTYGHPQGDRILAQVAQVVLKNSRETDIPIRYGGEEFIVFIPNSGAAALAFAERIRREVEETSFDLGNTRIRVTISGGIAAHRKHESLDDFMQRADQRLYISKNNGRNRTTAES